MGAARRLFPDGVAESNSNNFDTKVGRRGQYVARAGDAVFAVLASPASCAPSAGSTAPTPAATARRWTILRSISTSRRPAAAASSMATSSTSSRRSPTTSACSAAGAGTTATTRSWPSPTSTAACPAASRSRAAKWGRPDDVVGIGGAINGLSQDHRDFLAAGGLGVLIGDGALNYRTERILETYYAYALNKSVTLTADYQLITNPAYNADRGPVSVFSGRLHGEF